MLIFLVGALLGALIGAMICVRYLRSEISGNIGPRLQRLQLQLDSIQSELSLALMTRYAELSSRRPDDPHCRQ